MNLHTVRIADDLEIQFTCNGDRSADCHQYPDCGCEVWDDDHEHPKAPHDRCWMQDWFDNDTVDPSTDVLGEVDYTAGMSGPIKAYFREEGYIEWEFEVSAK